MTFGLSPTAPHLRSTLSVQGIFRRTTIATLPVVALALYNTGHQINLALANVFRSDWRTQLLEALGLGLSPSHPLHCFALGVLYVAPLFLTVLAAVALGEWCFAKARGRQGDASATVLISLLFVLGLPAGIPVWQAALGAAIGVVIGKEIFGGIGRSFVHPVVVGLAFLYFAYPAALSGDQFWIPGAATPTPLAVAAQSGVEGLQSHGWTWSALALGREPAALGGSELAVALGAAVLLAFRIASWRIIAGGVLGLLLTVVALQQVGIDRPIASMPASWHLVTGGFAFGLVFLATDPATSTTTNAGRWIYGLFVGLTVATIRLANPAHEDGTIPALLLANVSAPLIDWVVARVHYRIGWLRRGRGV